MNYKVIEKRTPRFSALSDHFEIVREGAQDADVTCWTSLQEAEFIATCLKYQKTIQALLNEIPPSEVASFEEHA